MTRLGCVRKKRGMTQLELSRRSEVSQQTISAIENGEVRNPGILTMLRLAEALECTVDEIIGQEDQPPKTAEE